jgi:transposase
MDLSSVQSFIGIDLHKTVLTCAVMKRNKDIREVKNIDTKCVFKIVDFIKRQPGPIACAIESVGMYEWLWDLLEPHVDYLFLADATEVKRKRKRGKAKTDKNDALLMARLMIIDDLPIAYVPEKKYRTLRKLGRHYHRVSKLTAATKVQMRWILNQHNIRGPVDLNAHASGKWLLAHIDKLDSSSVFAFRQHLGTIQKLELDKAAIVQEIKVLAKDPEFKTAFEIIRSVPGINYVIGFIVLAEIADFDRFHSGDAIGCYTGLTERTIESAGKKAKGHISRCGNPTLRWALVEAATTLVRHDTKYKAMYERLMKNMGGINPDNKRKAKVAMAQKLIRWIWKMMQSGELFRKGEPTDLQSNLNNIRLQKLRKRA